MSKNLEFIQVTLKSWQLLNNPPLKRGVFGLIVVGVFLLSLGINFQAADAQRISPGDLWRQVYQQLPDLPRENQYVSKETGKVAENNTLVSRMIWYHSYLKGRAPNYRLDWKLTLADYLGANEIMYDTAYPGNDTLRENPLNGDRAAIGRLNRVQRDALVQILVNIFNPNAQNTPAPANTSPNPATQRTPPPKPGDAELLR